MRKCVHPSRFGRVDGLYVAVRVSALFLAGVVSSCRQTTTVADRKGAATMKYEVTKPEAEWKEQLTPLQYRVTREKHTEPPFTGVYYDHKGTGMYVCVACGAKLFSSGTKYDSGCGWPSFWKPAEGAGIEEAPDTSHGMKRTEILCSRCGAHLGHLFEDGPQPTGLRYCVNSASLTFRETQSHADAPGKEGETEEVK